MEMYQTEEQQVEALKRWWQENSTSAITGVVLGTALIMGYNAWREHQQHMSEQASGYYQQMVKAMDAKQTESADRLSERIIQEYGSTAYGAFARLAQAKLKVDAGDAPAARRMLEGLLASSAEDKYKHVARLRLGQVLLESNDAKAALDLVEQQAKAGGFASYERNYELLKGDIYSALNRPTDALAAYQAAQRLGAASALLEMKLDELGGNQGPAHP
ncbi:MAG: tetratricopeptide repeat protein [Methylococcaceae bacterium]|nr:MAG: tetratricopeptide repeat protein [Methylococcaceae bacterium]